MKIIEQFTDAMARLMEAQREVDRLRAVLTAKVDGRGKRGIDRKPRKKRVPKAE